MIVLASSEAPAHAFSRKRKRTSPPTQPTPTPTSGIDFVQSFILSRWSPTTRNGWFPALSANGRYVTYGVQENWVADLTTGRETMTFERGFHGYWHRNDAYLFQADLPGIPVYEVSVADLNPTLKGYSPGGQFAAADGHWGSCNAYSPLYVDGSQLRDRTLCSIDTSQGLFVTAEGQDGEVVSLWSPSQTLKISRTVTSLMEAVDGPTPTLRTTSTSRQPLRHGGLKAIARRFSWKARLG